jgi:hypothetical protein
MHSGCLHWQGVSEAFFVSAHVVLQCFFPGSVGQLQALFSHFGVVVMKAPFPEQAFSPLKALLCEEYAPRSKLLGYPGLQRVWMRRHI